MGRREPEWRKFWLATQERVRELVGDEGGNTPTIRDIIWALQGHDDLHVFTIFNNALCDARLKAALPLARLRQAGMGFARGGGREGISVSTTATTLRPLLRQTGNLKLVQALNHADIATTTRYARAQ
jgi:hypothetical protein